MDLAHLAVQLMIAIACGMIGNMLIPREIPGKFFGLILVGFVGVWVGELGYRVLKTQYGVDSSFLQWHIEDVPIVPSIIGSAIVIYVVTTFLRWGRYSK
uniref:GlsB/YeaQ/YmgE family stress response membrane protein n=1 Tax=Oscillatoriales cyanobacterium SpSt-402 TaxID=2282168 RepID=A0A832H0N9_9CYAN